MRLALVLALAACGDNLPDTGEPHSGARLRLAWWVYDDGTRQRETSWYYDAQLGVRCTPSAFSDGVRYCAPESDEAVYTNDTCTRALGRVAIGSTPRPYFTTTFFLGESALPSRVFRAGAAPASSPPGVWHKHDGGCFGPFELGDFDYYELGDEVTSSQLVRVRRGTPRGRGDLAIVDETSSDGLRTPIALFDRARQVECATPPAANLASVPCVPADTAVASYFHEVGCLEPELATTQAPVPSVARAYSELTRCATYFDVGAQTFAPPLYEAIGGSCVSVAPPDGVSFYTMAGPAQLPELARTPAATPGRLHAITLVHGEVHLADERLDDTTLGTECHRDAQARCVPATEAQVMPFFADAGCQQPLEVALVPGGACDPAVTYARKGDDYYPLLAPLTVPFYELSTGDTCGVYNVPEPFVPYLVKPPLDPAAFATARLEIDS